MKKIFLAVILVTLTAFSSNAEKKTFTREYTYHATDYDSKASARGKAMSEVKSAILDDIGVYMESYAALIKNANTPAVLTFFKDELRSTSTGVGEPVVVNESWNGSEYYLKASITMDPDDLVRHLTKVVEHRASDAVLDSLTMVLTNAQASYMEQNQKVKDLSLQVDSQLQKIYTQEDEIKRLNRQVDSLSKVSTSINKQKEEANAKIAELQKGLRQLTDKAMQYARVGMIFSEFEKYCGSERTHRYISDSNYKSHYARNYGGVWIIFQDSYDNSIIEYGLSNDDFMKGNYDSKYNILPNLSY